MANEELRVRVQKAITDRGIMDRPCPMCGGYGWDAVPWYTFVTVSENTDVEIPGKSLRCVAINCRSCGFVSNHSAPALGL